MNTLLLWAKASRLPSQSYIALPLLLGQIIAYQQGHSISITVAVLVQLFGLFDQFYIVYANDYADRETDAHNATYTPFSGGSRVLAEGQLEPHHLARAAKIMAGLCVAITAAIGILTSNWLPLPLGLLGLFLLYAYSYEPFRLSYRGGGEFLQMLGVGVILPLLGYFAHTPLSTSSFPYLLLFLLAPTHLACGLSTALPDVPSDKLSSKNTLPVRIGVTPAHIAIVALNLLGAKLLYLCAAQLSPLPPDDVRTLALIIAAPAALSATLIPLSKPGTKPILVFVFLSILTTLLWTGGLSTLFWHAHTP